MKHIKLYESFDEDQDLVWYHGAKRADKNFVKAADYVGAKDAMDEQGPGLYLTTDEKDATKYGTHIYTINIKPEGRVILDDDELTYDDIKIAREIIKNHSEDWELHAQNFDIDPEKGLDQFLRGAELDATKVKDFYQSVWFDFFRYHGVDFIKGMADLGIDAVITDAYSGQAPFKHAIVYNPDIIEVVSQSERKSQ